MINLLPKPEKKILQRERQVRLGVVALIALAILEVLTAVLFIPSFYALLMSTSDITQTLNEREKLMRSPEGGGDVEKNLSVIRRQIAVLKSQNTTLDTPLSQLLKEIIEKKPAGIGLKTLSYSRDEKNTNFIFSGIAGTQQDLLTFQRNMKSSARPLEFKYANSFITKKTDIDFSVSMSFQ